MVAQDSQKDLLKKYYLCFKSWAWKHVQNLLFPRTVQVYWLRKAGYGVCEFDPSLKTPKGTLTSQVPPSWLRLYRACTVFSLLPLPSSAFALFPSQVLMLSKRLESPTKCLLQENSAAGSTHLPVGSRSSNSNKLGNTIANKVICKCSNI